MRDALELYRERETDTAGYTAEMLIWDYARIINLSRGGFDAGYLTREEALSFIERCAEPIRNHVRFWKQLSVSYQLP